MSVDWTKNINSLNYYQGEWWCTKNDYAVNLTVGLDGFKNAAVPLGGRWPVLLGTAFAEGITTCYIDPNQPNGWWITNQTGAIQVSPDGRTVLTPTTSIVSAFPGLRLLSTNAVDFTSGFDSMNYSDGVWWFTNQGWVAKLSTNFMSVVAQPAQLTDVFPVFLATDWADGVDTLYGTADGWWTTSGPYIACTSTSRDTWNISPCPLSQRLGRIIFDQPGDYYVDNTFPIPEDVVEITVEMWGPGGDAGESNGSLGGRGGAGAYLRDVFPFTTNSHFTFHVGGPGDHTRNGATVDTSALVAAGGGGGGGSGGGGPRNGGAGGSGGAGHGYTKEGNLRGGAAGLVGVSGAYSAAGGGGGQADNGGTGGASTDSAHGNGQDGADSGSAFGGGGGKAGGGVRGGNGGVGGGGDGGDATDRGGAGGGGGGGGNGVGGTAAGGGGGGATLLGSDGWGHSGAGGGGGAQGWSRVQASTQFDGGNGPTPAGNPPPGVAVGGLNSYVAGQDTPAGAGGVRISW
ncbi:hypothetical protein GO998_17970 (plasmid) [Ralstonia syzygii]|uniref:Minor tail protein n=1 Tax=Ralstonia syzygii TaxID=28097 RepID=A0ABX7ZKY5_9RALS|nr:hypothetical protein [Ralstonia syzygii]QUP55653.1 hypothetical protein GO998_17970 [Ralstonia syzygii]